MKLMKNRSPEIIPIIGITDVESPHWAIKEIDDPAIKQLKFPFNKLGRCRDKSLLYKPGDYFAIMFIPGKGAIKTGLKGQHEYFIHGDKLWKRLTWHDIALDLGRDITDRRPAERNGRRRRSKYCLSRGQMARKASGLRVIRENKLIYYVREYELLDEVRKTIESLVGSEL